MSNVFDYLSWRGDLPLSVCPFNDIDNLILSRLSYIPFDGIVPEDFKAAPVAMKDAAALCLKKAAEQPEKRTFRMEDDAKLLQAMIDSPRFHALSLIGYVNRFDPAVEKQFSAICIKLDKNETFVAYRGTDGTLVGWKEDFNMSFATAVPAQLDSVAYLEKAASAVRGNLRVGGHSKGGNLAVYASAFCKPATKKRIVQIYSNDGPGFNADVTTSSEYAAIVDRVKTFVPQSSIIGQLLTHEEKLTIIHSTNVGGLLQHDLYSWEVLRDEFVLADALTNNSKVIDMTLKQWLSAMDPTLRAKMIDGVYSIFAATDAVTLTDLTKSKNAVAVIKAMTALDEPTRQVISEGFSLLGASFKKTVPEAFTEFVQKEKEKQQTLPNGTDAEA